MKDLYHIYLDNKPTFLLIAGESEMEAWDKALQFTQAWKVSCDDLDVKPISHKLELDL